MESAPAGYRLTQTTICLCNRINLRKKIDNFFCLCYTDINIY
jgi:hypothetical protein